MKASTPSLVPFALLMLVLSTVGWAQTTVRIGTASGKPGQTVSVPVTLSATTSHTAVLARIQYNSAALESPSVTAGALLSSNHVLDSNSPAPGRFNVAAYAPSGMPSFKAKSGTLFSLMFRIKPTAPVGVSPITFTTVGTPALPSSDLVAITGATVSPSAVAGSVTVSPTAADASWLLYR
ncbi:hypothetical protein FJY63_05195 [Candidatus Sumerlaeota bacterium]|nr:hypothetical protein [Candidatus Sumerlaeota bacterium]